MQIIACKMVQNFQMEWAGEKPLGLEWVLFNGIDGPLKLKLTDARDGKDEKSKKQKT